MENFSPFQCEKKWQLRPKAVLGQFGRGRTFLHVDLDAFFASVEQIKKPELRGKPVVVGGRSPRRGVVAAASYEAKRCGIKAGMPWGKARQLCPEAIFLPADFESYAMYASLVRKIMERMAPVVAPASVDEAYLDITGCERLYGTALEAAEKIRSAVFRRTGLSVSVGIASTHSIAKLASAVAKPAGILEIPAGSEARFLAPLSVETMPGIGSRLGEALRGMGVETLGQLAQFPAALLQRRFGVYGSFLLAKARGHDNWELEITEKVHSIGKEETFEKDLVQEEELLQRLFALVEQVGGSLRKKHYVARGVRVKIRYSDFSGEAASHTLKDPTCFDRVLFREAVALIHSLWVPGRPVRLIGFTAADLAPANPQMDLFRTPKATRWERLYRGIDLLRDRFGKGIVGFK